MRSREEGGTCKNPSQSDHSLSLASESTRQARRKNECTSYRCRYVRYKQALFCANLKERIVPKNMLVKSTLLITSNMVHCTETCKANSNSKCFVPTLVPSVLSPLKFQVFCPHSNSKCFVPTLIPSEFPTTGLHSSKGLRTVLVSKKIKQSKWALLIRLFQHHANKVYGF